MSRLITVLVDRVITRLVSLSQRFRFVVIGLALVISALSAWFTASHVAINTNTEDMLSETLAWRVAYNDFKSAFPYFSDTIVVVIDAATADLAREAAGAITAQLRLNPDDFPEVFNPADDDFFRRNQLLYASPTELDGLVDQLSGAQALLGRLAADPSLGGLLELLRDISRQADAALPAQASAFLRNISRAIDEQLSGIATPMSWQALFLGDASASQNRVIFSVKPRLDFSALLPAEDAMRALHAMIKQLGYDLHSDVKIRLTGEAALGYDELKSVIRGAEEAGLIAFVMIALCLVIGLGSLSLVIATLITLVVGLIATATFAVVTVGTLNMISIAFALLYVGLGVDFAIHLSLRYRELCATYSQPDALTATAKHLGTSLVLCASTTAISFFAFIPTAYRGVAELGLISGVGMFIGLLTSFTLLPALLRALPAPRPAAAPPPRALAISALTSRSRAIVTLSSIIAIVAVSAVPFARFDLNPLHLNDQDAESVTTIADLATNGEQPIYNVSLVVADAATAATVRTELEQLTTVATVTDATDLVPKEQMTKLASIEDLRWSLGGDLEVMPPRELDLDEILQAISALKLAMDAGRRGTNNGAVGNELNVSLIKLEAALMALDRPQAEALLVDVQRKLLHHFGPEVSRLLSALDAEPVDQDALPATVLQRWLTQDGRYRLEISPRENLDNNDALVRFVDTLRTVAGESATGTPIINLEASRAVTAAFYQAFASAGILITALLWIALRRRREVVVVLAPLALAGLLTVGLNVMLSIPFNFANIIALPLLMGIGVDSALHMLHRYKTASDNTHSLLHTSTARAVLFSALTTTASFGNLAVSPHAGTASMGVMLSIGLAMTLLCTLVVMPALLRLFIIPTGRSS